MEADKQKDRKMTRAEISVEADRILIEQMQRLETIAKKGSMVALAVMGANEVSCATRTDSKDTTRAARSRPIFINMLRSRTNSLIIQNKIVSR